MAIEPVSSAMTYQAQNVQRVESTRATETNNKEVITEGTVRIVDSMTQSVQKNSNADENGGRQDGQSQNQPPNEKIKQAVEDLNKKMTNSEAIFGIHEKTNRVTIRIVDKDSKKVIKEFPPEKTLDMIAKVWELAGLLVDEKR